MRLKMIYKCENCHVEYMGDFKIDHDKKCSKCGAFMKIRLWQADEQASDFKELGCKD